MSEGSGLPGATAGGSARGARRLLIASLAINLLVIGAVAGSMMTWRKHGPWHRNYRGEDFGILGFSRQIAPERRKEVRKTITRARTSLKPLWMEMHAARQEAAAVLAAEPFDRDKLQAAVDKIMQSEMKLKASGLAILVNTAEQLNPDERQALSEWWQKKRGGGGHFRFQHRRDETDPPEPADDTPR